MSDRSDLYAVRDSFIGMERHEQIRNFETEGFVILPDVLAPDHVARIQAELKQLPMRPSFFTDAPAFAKVPPHTHGPEAGGLIFHRPTLDFVEDLMGEDIVFMHSFYILSHPGAPALDLHSDVQPFGSTYSGWLESCPLRVRVLYYLDDTRDDRSALRIVPRSHICWHADANPYRRAPSHPDEIIVPVKAGDAFVFATRMFHASTPNTTDETRGMMEYDYRPAWARPYGPVPDWTDEEMAFAREPVKRLTRSRNHADFLWEFDAKRVGVEDPAPGMSPHRWDKKV